MLTRFKLQLAMLGDDPQVKELQNDVNEMQHMLEDYVAFVRGDGGEVSVETDVGAMLEDIRCRAATQDFPVSLDAPPNLAVAVKPNAFKRCVSNLVSNAARFATRVDIRVARDDKYLRISVDDNGPGIPEDMRDDVFRPFFRLDDARNQDTGGTGLGLAIARDIARSHGGDIRLSDSPLGGLRATVRVPV
jgi:two-component system osmolarity sensor histidine kinase EnvZ